ncbi:ATP-grasp domain-containing protein [Burkholderia cenocepacia]|uniref:ATP-grasp domain-containing protein n=1 Tax=Burkholderia cenocepacia TaxID=95486 RepID=UPI001588EA44|nr:ATP-grasp domain-containing protein [Burkholderia cenocepacia]
MTRIAYTRSTEVQNAAPYLPGLQQLFEKRDIHAKLFYTRGECRNEDFPGEVERIDEDISASSLARRLIGWRPDGVISLAIPDENAVRDSLVGEILAQHAIRTIVHPVTATQVFSNKWETKLALAQFGLKTPKAILLDGDLANRRNIVFPAYRELIHRNASEIGYPVLTKPLWDSLGNGIEYHRNAESLNSYLASPYDGNVVLEKFLDGVLCSVEVIGSKGKYLFQPILWKGQTELKSTFFFNEVRHSVVGQQERQIFAKTAKHIVELCDHFNIEGVIEVEMIFHDGDYYVIEINPRVSGTTVLSAASSNVNTFEALTHMLLGSWNEFASRHLNSGESGKFSLQFPYLDFAAGASREVNITLVKANDFYRDGVLYRNAIISGRYEAISELQRDIESRFRVSEDVMDKIRRIAHATPRHFTQS